MSLSSTALVTLTQAKAFMRRDASVAETVHAEYVGTGNDSDTEFVLDHTPISGSLRLYVDNVLMVEGTNFTISGATITFTVYVPDGDVITANYQYAPTADTFESYDDEILEFMINAATKKCEDYTGRCFINQTITDNFYGDGTEWVRLSRGPVNSVTSVTLDGTALTVDSDYLSFIGSGRLKRSFLWDYEDPIVIVYTAGYGATRALAQAAVPEAVMAVLTTLAYWYENRLGLKSESVSGVGSVAYPDPGELPDAAKRMLSNLDRNLI